MKEVLLKLTIDEVNLLFKALGKQPFEEVYTLIGKINSQANEQLSAPNGNVLNGFSTTPDSLNKQ